MGDAGVHIAQVIHPLKMLLVHSWWMPVHLQIFHKNTVADTQISKHNFFFAYNRFLLNCREHSWNV